MSPPPCLRFKIQEPDPLQHNHPLDVVILTYCARVVDIAHFVAALTQGFFSDIDSSRYCGVSPRRGFSRYGVVSADENVADKHES